MGRPLRKDVNGLDVIGTPASSNIGITVNFYQGGSNRTDGVIVKQRGGSSFTCCRIGDIGDTTAGKQITCKLTNGTPSAAYEMQMTGSTSGQLDADLVNIAKITKRIATDFSGNKYKWYIESDSSADYIVLTAL
jgi:hypothetical protein